MDMGINSTCSYDHSLSCKCFCRCAHCHSGCHTIHDVRISGFTDSCNLAVFDTDICFYDSCRVYDQCIGNYQIQISVFTAGFYRLSHTVTDCLAAAELYFVSIGCIIFFYLDHKACICQTYLISCSRAIHCRIFASGNFCTHCCPSLQKSF